MDKEYEPGGDRKATLMERVDQQSELHRIKDEQIERILNRLRRLEERMDEVLGSEPREAEVPLRGHDRR